MKVSMLKNTLEYILATDGDMDVEISIAKPTPADLQENPILQEQRYLLSEAVFCDVTDRQEGKSVSIRDWPY